MAVGMFYFLIGVWDLPLIYLQSIIYYLFWSLWRRAWSLRDFDCKADKPDNDDHGDDEKNCLLCVRGVFLPLQPSGMVLHFLIPSFPVFGGDVGGHDECFNSP